MNALIPSEPVMRSQSGPSSPASAGKPFSRTMRRFARDKVVALDGVVERARLMQSLLGAALRCTCLTLEDCGRRLRRLDPT